MLSDAVGPVRGGGERAHRQRGGGPCVLAPQAASWSSRCQRAEVSVCVLAILVTQRVVTATVLSAGAAELGRNWREGRGKRPETELSHLNLSQPQVEAITKHHDEKAI